MANINWPTLCVGLWQICYYTIVLLGTITGDTKNAPIRKDIAGCRTILYNPVVTNVASGCSLMNTYS